MCVSFHQVYKKITLFFIDFGSKISDRKKGKQYNGVCLCPHIEIAYTVSRFRLQP